MLSASLCDFLTANLTSRLSFGSTVPKSKALLILSSVPILIS
ncbi:MAG: hypothetical protein ROM03_09680 [Mucispirillum sp.]|nr:hypothetical protein [Mucispirillum sp.]